MDATAYYAIGIPLYIALFGVESLVAWARRHPTPAFAGSLSNICSGLGALLVAFASYVYGLPRDAWPFALAGGALVIATIIGIGGVLDDRRGARIFETIRLGVFVPVATVIVATTWGA